MASTTFSGPVTSLNGFIGDITGDITASELVVSANATTDAVRITQTGTGNALVVEDSANPDATPFVISAAGNVGIGTTTPGAALDVVGTSFVQNTRFNSTTAFVVRRANGTAASPTVVLNNENQILRFDFYDGTTYLPGAGIFAEVDGTPGTNDMPCRLIFSTTADGAASLTERMRITNAGNVGIGVSAPVNRLQISGSFGRGAPVTKTGNFTLADTENWIICNGAGSITATLPAASSWTGREVMIKTIAAQTVVSASSNVVPIAGGAAGTAILAATAGAWATLVSDGTNWVIMQA